MSRADWLADVLRDAGLQIKPFPGWMTRGKGDFEPVGIVWHHTVTNPTSSDTRVDNVLAIMGSSAVPAPLCNYSTNRDGTISIIASGTANHAGIGEWAGRAGNRFFLGDEMKNAGTANAEPWSPPQLDAARLAAATILNHLEQSASMLCGHKEYARPPGRKVDPHSLNMPAERLIVAEIMEAEMARFKDVPEDHPHYKAIEWLADEEITSGINPPDNDLFGPDQPVTRAQFATMLRRYWQNTDKQ